MKETTGTMWFRYERMNGRWHSHVYHDRQPRKAREDHGEVFSQLWQVPEDCIDIDGSPNFGRLQKRFPMSDIAVEPEKTDKTTGKEQPCST